MTVPTRLPIECQVQLPGWKLHLAHLSRRFERELGPVMETARRGAVAHAREACSGALPRESPDPARIRRELCALGLDPERVPPCSELLVGRALESAATCEGSLAWQFLCVLTLKSLAPWTVLRSERLRPPLIFRTGLEGERLPGEPEPLGCRGLPILADAGGPLASPWTLPMGPDLAGCPEPLFICFLPAAIFREFEPMSHMGRAVWLTWAYQFLTQRSHRLRPAGPD